MRSRELLAALLTISHGYASESVFSVNDDVLAYPQYDILFLESYITSDDAILKLKGPNPHKDPVSSWEGDVSGQLAKFYAEDEADRAKELDEEDDNESYQDMFLNNRSYLCSIPKAHKSVENKTEQLSRESKEKKDLAKAASRGSELLQDMEGSPCLFFSTGWWSYSFCYNSQVKQFHSLPPGTPGVPRWPPAEDPTTPSYVLGKFQKSNDQPLGKDAPAKGDVAELQTKAETSYLVQRLDGGTACDLTGQDRKVEVQFHCHPQSTDRIGWIKETATCAYLMVIYTPRLCNDIAFLPPKDTRVNTISCREVLKPEDVSEWEVRKSAEATRKLIGPGTGKGIVVGNVEVGAMKDVGQEGRRIERGRVVLTPEERAETVAMQKDGQIQGLSKADLKKLELNPEDVDAFKKELQKLAGSKDWKIERLDDVNGHIQLRGVVASDTGKKEDDTMVSEPRDDEEGSEEEYKEDL